MRPFSNTVISRRSPESTKVIVIASGGARSKRYKRHSSSRKVRRLKSCGSLNYRFPGPLAKKPRDPAQLAKLISPRPNHTPFALPSAEHTTTILATPPPA